MKTIKQCENNSKYKGTRIYSDKRKELKEKADNLYTDAWSAYCDAPAGTIIETTIKNKMNKINELRDEI